MFSKAQGNLGTLSLSGKLFTKSTNFYEMEILVRRIIYFIYITSALCMLIAVKASCMEAPRTIKNIAHTIYLNEKQY